MTRRDYVRIAAALRSARPIDEPRNGGDLMAIGARAAWLTAVEHVALALAQDNPRFDRARFYAAAGGAA
jgi:hypothetical protein